MAVYTQGTRLTERYKRELNQLQLRAAREVVQLWRLLDPADIDGSYPAYESEALRLIADNRVTAAELAAAYYLAFRVAEGAPSPYRPVEISVFDLRKIMASLRVTGPVYAKSLISKGIAARVALNKALVVQAGAITRHVADAGRETIDEAAADDPEAIGWMRVASPTACAFCAMLASRGPAYQSEDTALFTESGQKYHDHCGCVVEPVFSRDTALPDSTLRYRALWDAAGARYSGDDQRRAFRALLEGREYTPRSR